MLAVRHAIRAACSLLLTSGAALLAPVHCWAYVPSHPAPGLTASIALAPLEECLRLPPCRNDPVNNSDPLGLLNEPPSSLAGPGDATYPEPVPGRYINYNVPDALTHYAPQMSEEALRQRDALAAIPVSLILAPALVPTASEALLFGGTVLQEQVLVPLGQAVARSPLWARAAIALLTGYEETQQGRQETAQVVTRAEESGIPWWRTSANPRSGSIQMGPAAGEGKPPVIGQVRSYNEAKSVRIPGYDNHHLDPPLGRTDPTYNTGPTIPVRNDNAGGKIPGGINLHTGKDGFQDSLNQYIGELGFTRTQWVALPEETRRVYLRRYYVSLGIPFEK